MIEVKFQKFNNGQFKFSCTGHAGSGVKGEDLVCAGVSSLAEGFLFNMLRLSEACDEFTQSKTEGSIKISCKPKPEHLTSIEFLIDAKYNEFNYLRIGREDYVSVLMN